MLRFSGVVVLLWEPVGRLDWWRTSQVGVDNALCIHFYRPTWHYLLRFAVD